MHIYSNPYMLQILIDYIIQTKLILNQQQYETMQHALCVAGVAQVLNRLDGKPFDDADQRLFEV